MGSSLLPTNEAGKKASPWEQSSRDKCHTPVLSRVERGVRGRCRWKIHHLAYHPGKPTCTEERNQCETGAAFPPPTSLYLSNMRGTSDRLEWAVSWLQALSCTPPPPPFSLAPTYISLYTCIYMRTHAGTQRGPCNFHVELGDGGEGKEDGRRGACL